MAARRLRAGAVIAYPTEGVWGLGCDPWNPDAVGRLLQLKRRLPEKGLILVAASAGQLHPWLADLPPELRARISARPGQPTTWLVPDHRGIAPPWIRGDSEHVALRVSDHPVIIALCQAFGGPVVSTSANPSGREAARTRLAARRYFGRAVDDYLPGSVGTAKGPSTIVDLISGKVLRRGSTASGPETAPDEAGERQP